LDLFGNVISGIVSDFLMDFIDEFVFIYLAIQVEQDLLQTHQRMLCEEVLAEGGLQNFAFVIHPGWTFVFLLILLIDFIADILICPAHATLLSSSRGGSLRGAGPPGFAAQCSAPTRLCALRGIFGRTGPFQKSNP